MLNTQLQQLYERFWRDLESQYDEINSNTAYKSKPTTPLLIRVGNEAAYHDADIRIMFFGQETNGWYEEDDKMEGILQSYDNFFNNYYCFKYGGQFWNGVSRFLNLFKRAMPDVNTSFLWNNVVKIGKSEGRGFPPDYVFEMEQKYFPIHAEEITILKPDLVVFMSGPNYDNVIKQNFGPIGPRKIESFSERQLARISVKDIPVCYRTYHPNYLWRNGIDDYFNAIINDFKLTYKW